MTKQEMYQSTIENTIQFGGTNSLLKLKVETVHFDFIFERQEDNTFRLTSTKAVIRTLGKVTKVPLKDGDTWEEAHERTRQHWSKYFKSYRQQLVPTQEQRVKAMVRTKRYRSNKRQANKDFLTQG